LFYGKPSIANGGQVNSLPIASTRLSAQGFSFMGISAFGEVVASERQLSTRKQLWNKYRLQRGQCRLPAYSVEKLVCKMSDFVARVSMRGLRSG